MRLQGRLRDSVAARVRVTNTVPIPCAGCGTQVEVAPHLANRAIRCPACRHQQRLAVSREADARRRPPPDPYAPERILRCIDCRAPMWAHVGSGSQPQRCVVCAHEHQRAYQRTYARARRQP